MTDREHSCRGGYRPAQRSARPPRGRLIAEPSCSDRAACPGESRCSTATRWAERAGAKRALTALSALTLALVAACSSSGSNAAPASSGGSGSSATGGQQAPVASGVSNQESAALTALYKGTLQPPSSASRPAVKGKKIVIISAGQSSISSSIPVDATEQAAKAIGWQVSIYDEQLNPANAPGLMRQAISSGADGIIMDATDCPTIKGPLQEAKAKGIPVLGIYSFDCNDPAFGGGGQPLFSGYINYGIKGNTLAQLTLAADKFTESYGAAQADAMIAATNGHAKIIYFNDPEFVVLHYTGEGFLNEINPGNSTKGRLIFDVPKSTKLTALELHDSPFSGGVEVSLS